MKVEIFDKDFNFILLENIISINVKQDYNTLEETEISIVNNEKADIGQYVHVTDNRGQIVFQGVITKIDLTAGIVLRCKDLIAILDRDVYFDRNVRKTHINSMCNQQINV